MKTLKDYIRGYEPTILIDSYIKNGKKLFLVKEDTRNNYFYMDGDEVVYAKHFVDDTIVKVSVDVLNGKADKSELEKYDCYKQFKKFIEERTNANEKI